MPYIAPEEREAALEQPLDIGELTYAICELVNAYVKAISFDKPRFSTYGEVVAALECAKLEFYRRSVVPHEKKKVKEHGDLDWP